MNAIAGGPSGNPVSMVMSSMGGGGGGHMMMGGGANGAAGSGPNGNIFNTGHGMPMPGSHSTHECIGTKLCMQGCKGQYELGPVGKDGCQSCTCKTGMRYFRSIFLVFCSTDAWGVDPSHTHMHKPQ